MTPAELYPQDAEGAPRARRRLYTTQAVTIATFLGSPLAGGIVMAINYRRLGNPRGALQALVWSAVFTAVVIAVAILLPDDIKFPRMVLVMPQFIVMAMMAKRLQGAAIEKHKARGGRMASNWGAAGIGALGMLAVLAVLLAFSFSSLGHPWGSRYVTYGTGSCMYYDEAISSEEAKAAGEALIAGGVPSTGQDYRLQKTAAGYRLSAIFPDELAFDPDIASGVRVLGAVVSAKALGQAPVSIVICDEYGKVKDEAAALPWGKVYIASKTEKVFYAGEASEADARAVAALFRKEGFFDGSSHLGVHIGKSKDGYVLEAISYPTLALDLDIHTAWREIADQLSKQVFKGKPVKYRPAK